MLVLPHLFLHELIMIMMIMMAHDNLRLLGGLISKLAYIRDYKHFSKPFFLIIIEGSAATIWVATGYPISCQSAPIWVAKKAHLIAQFLYFLGKKSQRKLAVILIRTLTLALGEEKNLEILCHSLHNVGFCVKVI